MKTHKGPMSRLWVDTYVLYTNSHIYSFCTAFLLFPHVSANAILHLYNQKVFGLCMRFFIDPFSGF